MTASADETALAGDEDPSAVALAAAVRRGERTAAHALAACRRRVGAWEDPAGPALGAFLRWPGRGSGATPSGGDADLHVGADGAAAAVDARAARGEDPGPLAGVPVAVKDNLCVAGGETTAGSRILAGWRPPYDATAVARLRAAGAVVLGKTNLDELGMGSSTERSAWGPTRNPWDLARVPGGSSGGAAAAVAAGLAPLALGSDTGGSIRQPAALCGVVGVKPTWGLVSRWGLVAFASSLDTVGPLARCVEDAAVALDVLAGPDPLDQTTQAPPAAPPAGPEASPWRAGWGCDAGSAAGACAAAAGAVRRRAAGGRPALAGARLGYPRAWRDLAGVEPGVRAAVDEALERACAAGAVVVEVELARTELALPAYLLLATAEASSNLARYDGVHYGHRTADARDLDALVARTRAEGFGPEVKRRVLLGTFALSSGFYDAYYLRATRARRALRAAYLAALDGAGADGPVDALVGPTSPVVAFRLGERLADPMAMYAVDQLTVGVNLAGLPALSLPCGAAPAPDAAAPGALPVGLQLVGRAWSEPGLLALAAGLELAFAGATWPRRPPALAPRATDRAGGAP